jgi:hypothetical protein
MYPPMRLTMPGVWLLGERSSVMENFVSPQKGKTMQEVLTNDREWFDSREAQPCLPGMERPVQQWLPLWRLVVKPGGRTSCTPVPVEPNAKRVAPRGIDWLEAVFAGLGRLLRPA